MKRNKALVGLVTCLVWQLANAQPATPPDPGSVAKTCSACHRGPMALDKRPHDQLLEQVRRIAQGELAHPKLPEGVDIEALVDIIVQPGVTVP